MTFEWHITLGQVLTISIPLVVAAAGVIMGLWLFKLKAQILSSVKDMLDTFARGDTEHRAELVKINDDKHANAAGQIADTNRRLSDFAAGVSSTQTELREFKEHVQRHFVEKDEIAELRNSVDKSIDRMQASLDTATATMGDVRDAVIALTATGGKTTVPSARRPSRAKASS